MDPRLGLTLTVSGPLTPGPSGPEPPQTTPTPLLYLTMLTGITLAAALLVSPANPATSATLAPAASVTAAVHCQVPCGIYGDHLRVELITEHTATIEKAMKQIAELSAAETPNWNQLVRWVTTKDAHAQEIQDQVSAYWLAQRIKAPKAAPASDEFQGQNETYMTQLVMAHRLTTYAMKCKQTTDLANVQGLRSSLDALKAAYFSPEDMDHIGSHDKAPEPHDHADEAHPEHEHKGGEHKEGDHKEGDHK